MKGVVKLYMTDGCYRLEMTCFICPVCDAACVSARWITKHPVLSEMSRCTVEVIIKGKYKNVNVSTEISFKS